MTTLLDQTAGPPARVRKARPNLRKATPTVRPLAHNPIRAAELLNVSPSTIANEIRAGKLRAVKRGRSTLILDDDLVAYAQSLPTVK
jgi:excisionase family DNA binding protein